MKTTIGITIGRRARLAAAVLLGASMGCGPGSESTGSTGTTGAPAEDFFLAEDGTRLFVRVEPGRGEPIVVVHGGPGCDSAYLIPDLDALRPAHTLVFYDQRGGGRSGLPEDDAALSLAHHIADLEALRRHLGRERLTILAHSWGPLLAAAWAAEHPDRVERMIWIGPLPPRRGEFWTRFQENVAPRLGPGDAERMNAGLAELREGADPVQGCRDFWEVALKPRLAQPEDDAPKIRGDFCAAPVEALRFGLLRTNPVTMASVGDWDLREAVSAVRAPVLILHGEAEAIPLDLVEEWTSVLPDARLVPIAGAAHFPYVERPDLVWPAVERFLAED